MQNVTAVSSVVVLSVLLGSSGGVQAGENFVLMVNTTTGSVFMRSDFSSTVWINQYTIASPTSLTPAQWNSLHDQNVTEADWNETTLTATLLAESTASGQTAFQTGTGFGLGALFNTTAAPNVVFQYRLAGSATLSTGEVSYFTSFTPPPNPVHEDMPCYGDIDGSGAVGVPDLLLIINAWGSCSPPPGTCPADIAPPNGGNGAVGVPDLLAVINAWGLCR